MQKTLLKTVILLLFTGYISPAEAREDAQLCAAAVSAHESAHGIPEQLLTAISYAETGRYDRKKKAYFAWPWTVTAEGKGSFFPTKEDAISFVRKLQMSGIKSIDVGCMQINLYHHAKAFDSLDEAFDPDKNVGYAAKFLKGLFKENKSWITSAGYYHSQTPFYFERYRARVLERWEIARAEAGNDKLDKSKLMEYARPAPSLDLAAAEEAPAPKLAATPPKDIFEADAQRKAAVMAAWEERKRSQLRKRLQYTNAVRNKPVQIAQN